MILKRKAAIERPRKELKPAHATPTAVVDDSIFEGDFRGLENITASVMAWLDDNPFTGAWVDAIEAIDKRGDKEQLTSLLKSDFKLTPKARLFLADMIDRYQLKPKRGRKPTPAYHRSPVEWRLECAIEDVRAHRGEIDVALREIAQRYAEYGITEKKLKNAFEGRRGSTRRMKARREETRRGQRRQS
jgi:hypothetical protein